MFNPFKKIIRDFTYNSIMRELYFNNAEFKGIIRVTSELYLVKEDRDWYVFCVKPNWKKPIGVKRESCEDTWYTDWYCGENKRISCVKEWRTSRRYYDIPEEMRKETINQIIDNCKNIEGILSTLKVEEWYE